MNDRTDKPSSESVQRVLRWLLSPESDPYKRGRIVTPKGEAHPNRQLVEEDSPVSQIP